MFALTWSITALDQLAEVYIALDPDQRERLAANVEALNARLRADPSTVGESRSGTRRIAFIPLLAVLFHVSEVNHTVGVARVRRYGK
jgi:hypothetical protein